MDSRNSTLDKINNLSNKVDTTSLIPTLLGEITTTAKKIMIFSKTVSSQILSMREKPVDAVSIIKFIKESKVELNNLQTNLQPIKEQYEKLIQNSKIQIDQMTFINIKQELDSLRTALSQISLAQQDSTTKEIYSAVLKKINTFYILTDSVQKNLENTTTSQVISASEKTLALTGKSLNDLLEVLKSKVDQAKAAQASVSSSSATTFAATAPKPATQQQQGQQQSNQASPTKPGSAKRQL